MAIKVELEEELERKFRELAMRKFGYSKGSIKKATEKAIKRWTEEEQRPRPRMPKEERKNPADLLVGLLADTKVKGKKSSVELRHEASRLWTKAAVN
ncbi:MAG: hypothetical protein ACRECH_09910 [Nitrososphaerales archaeon]